MERVCFRLQVRADRLAEYRERHTAVWPEMLQALADAGWQRYSLFLGADGLLIGYLETESLDLAVEQMQHTEVNRRWQQHMASFFEELGGASPDTGFTRLEEVFHLEDQLAAAGPADPRQPDQHHEQHETRDE